MNSSFRIGLLAGLIAGAFATLVVTAILRPRPEPAPPPPPASSALVEVSAALKEENRVLREKVAELEKAKAAPPRKEEKPEAEKPAGPELKERFAKMIEAEGKSGFPEALAALKASGKPAIEFLAGILRSSTVSLERLMAAALLEQSGDAAAVEPLALALKSDKDDIVRRMAARALAVLALPAGEGPLRAASADDTDWGVRVNSAYGLAKLGKEDGLRLLRESYESTDSPAEYRLAILGGLADVAAPSTAPLFRKILGDTKDPSYVLMSIKALEKMKDAESIPALERIAASTQAQMVKQAATKAIETIRK